MDELLYIKGSIRCCITKHFQIIFIALINICLKQEIIYSLVLDYFSSYQIGMIHIKLNYILIYEYTEQNMYL